MKTTKGRPPRILLATTNAGKLLEQRRMLEGLPFTFVALDELPLPPSEPPDEAGPSFRDNAVAKARYYHERTGLPAVGEDSGLVVDALGGGPGVSSARWLGANTPFSVKNGKLIERLAGVSEERRSARFVSSVALFESGRVVFECEETCEGRIATEPKGSGGFGYDPIFFYPPFGRTLAEVADEEKDEVSHRGKAMARLREFLVRRASADDPSPW